MFIASDSLFTMVQIVKKLRLGKIQSLVTSFVTDHSMQKCLDRLGNHVQRMIPILPSGDQLSDYEGIYQIW